MNEQLTKELAQKIMKVKGEVRGIVFKTDAEFILKEKGKKALEKVEAELKRIGFPLNYQQIKTMYFYPLGLRVVSLLAIKKVCNFSDRDIERMGARAPKVSLVIKLFLKFFFSISKTVKQAPKMWEKHYTAGKLFAKSDEEKKYALVRLEELELHPVFCSYLKGYFSTVIWMIVNSPVTVREIKCTFKGDKYHEFLLTW